MAITVQVDYTNRRLDFSSDSNDTFSTIAVYVNNEESPRITVNNPSAVEKHSAIDYLATYYGNRLIMFNRNKLREDFPDYIDDSEEPETCKISWNRIDEKTNLVTEIGTGWYYTDKAGNPVDYHQLSAFWFIKNNVLYLEVNLIGYLSYSNKRNPELPAQRLWHDADRYVTTIPFDDFLTKNDGVVNVDCVVDGTHCNLVKVAYNLEGTEWNLIRPISQKLDNTATIDCEFTVNNKTYNGIKLLPQSGNPYTNDIYYTEENSDDTWVYGRINNEIHVSSSNSSMGYTEQSATELVVGSTESVTLTAIAISGYKFKEWTVSSGEYEITSGSLSTSIIAICPSTNVSFTANFIKN